MDGVLVDSIRVMEAAWLSTCLEFQLKIEFSQYLEHVGKPFELILASLGISPDRHSMIKSSYGHYSMENFDLIRTFKNVRRVLHLLNINGFKTGIVTSKEFWRADFIVDRFNLKTHQLITPEFTSKGKPDPEPLLLCAKYLSSLPEECIYIGDMSSDSSAAKAALMPFAFAAWGYGDAASGISFDSMIDVLDFLGVFC